MTDLPLSISAQIVWVGGVLTARAVGAAEVEIGHLMLAVLQFADSMWEQQARALNVDEAAYGQLEAACRETARELALEPNELTSVRRRLARSMRDVAGEANPSPALHRTPASREVFDEAAAGAADEGVATVSSVHLARRLVARGALRSALEGPPVVDATAGDHPGELRAGGTGHPGGDLGARSPVAPPAGPGDAAGRDKTRRELHALGRDLSALARDGRLRPVVGRDGEIKQLARRLQRSSKRNALLIGDPGVGKTAVVEGLALFCLDPSAPEALRRLRFIEISVGDLMAGTRYHGDLEARVQSMVSVLRGDPDLVAFIDEVHLALTGQGEGSGVIANLLKPVLVGDDVRCIAATTTEEYERYVKQDPAFARRFGTPIIVGEPSRDVALQILERWRERIESVHPGLSISDEALVAAVDLSVAHIPNRRLPDKAIDLLDDAATFAILPTIHVKNMDMAMDGGVPSKGITALTRASVEAVLKEQYGVEVALLGPDQASVREALGRELVGQEAAVDRIAGVLASARRGDADDRRPLAILLFTGPTGVGKTFAAELIAQTVFGSSRKLCRINMNEYVESHQISRLTGAPPGYLGHERPGALFSFVEGNPEGVILLDEIEKAHPEVWQYFLQVFDTGETMDSRGRRASFAPYVFAMTSNILIQAPREALPLGFARPDEDSKTRSAGDVGDEERTRQALAQLMSPEFVARVDAIVMFQELTPAALDDLVDRTIAKAVTLLLERDGVAVTVSDGALTLLQRMARSQAEGARGVRRLVDREVVAKVRAAPASGGSMRLAEVGGQIACDSGSV
jgi:ATP-dependent Clp protease ATP-binding subunit ClpC